MENIIKDILNINKKLVHIRILHSNEKKNITLIENLDSLLDIKKILKYIKKIFNCNGSIIADINNKLIIQLQGDQRLKMRNFLISENICKENTIKLHGF
tara:strand:- start:8017 stop:8313 length:297 start_codon:yes stop_codon:yes gene_type:complete